MTTKIKKIPHGWKEVKLGEVGDFSKGKGISKNEIIDQGYFAIRYAEIYTKYDFKANNITSFISEESAQNSKLIQRGDLIFAGSGESAEDIGKSVVYLKNEKCFVGGDTIIFTPTNNKTDSLFLSYQLNTPKVRIEISKKSTGQSVVHIYKKDLESLSLLLPPLPTQQKIVEILETWDHAIDKLGRKIEIKKEVKRGLMQQLLNYKLLIVNGELIVNPDTSKPPKDWKEVKLGEVAKIKKGKQLNRLDMIEDGEYPVLNGGISFSGYTNNYNTLENTITISEGGNSCGFVTLLKEKFWSGGHLYTLSFSEKNSDLMFLYQILKFKEINIMRLRVGSGLPNIQKSTLEKFKLTIPPLPEQKAIAEVLSTADQEIAALEAKLDLYKQQKKYLLNKLMTGEIVVNC